MSVAVYPKGIIPWTNRVDLVNVVYAADPNALAAEIGAIESTVGVMPQVENSPPSGPPIPYSTVSARVHDAMVGSQQPVVEVGNNSFTVPSSAPTGTFNYYNTSYDPWNWYNGNDITVAADGWYTLSANQGVDWAPSGYMHLSLYINSTWIADDHWSWDFPENGPNGRWNGRDHVMGITWQGTVKAGQRIRAKTENGTGRGNIGVSAAYLRVKYDRQITSTFPAIISPPLSG